MKAQIDRMSVGEPEQLMWGTMPDGAPVLCIAVQGLRVLVEMTHGEVRALAEGGTYLVFGRELAQPETKEGAAAEPIAKRSSVLVGLDNMPLAVKP